MCHRLGSRLVVLFGEVVSLVGRSVPHYMDGVGVERSVPGLIAGPTSSPLCSMFAAADVILSFLFPLPCPLPCSCAVISSIPPEPQAALLMVFHLQQQNSNRYSVIRFTTTEVMMIKHHISNKVKGSKSHV